MKKEYINPTIEVVKIQTMQMLASSNEQQLQTGTATEWASRRGNFNFDEEDEY